MNKFYCLIILFLTCRNCEGQVTFQKVFNPGSGGTYSSVQQTSDGGYIVCGIMFSSSNFIYLIKTNSGGDTLWTKIYGELGVTVNEDIAHSVVQNTDGGYFITATTSHFNAGYKVYLIRTNVNGDTLWTKTYGGTGHDYGYSGQQTFDGGFIVVGYTNSFGAGSDDVYLLKTDGMGNIQWSKTLGGTSVDRGFCLQQTLDSGYVITGAVSSFGLNCYQVYLLKTNQSGDTLWTKAYGGTLCEIGNYVRQTTDGGYVIVGNTSSFGAGNYDVYLIRTNALGDTLWTKTYGGTLQDDGYCVKQTTDGGFIITGSYYNTVAHHDNLYLIKTDVDGDTLWTKIFGTTSSNCEGYFVSQTSDQGYIIAGSNSLQIYLIKTDSLGNSGCSQFNVITTVNSTNSQIKNPGAIIYSASTIQTIPLTEIDRGGMATTLCSNVGIIEYKDNSECNLFPNPFSIELNITAKDYEQYQIILQDITSRKLLQQKFTNSVSINTEQLAKGVYIYEIRNKNGVIKKGKVVKN